MRNRPRHPCRRPGRGRGAPAGGAGAAARAQAQLPVARARQAEAEANLVPRRIESNAANRLNESGFASETRAATATATVSAAEAAVESAAAQRRGRAGRDPVGAKRHPLRRGRRSARREELEACRSSPRSRACLESDTAELGALMQPGSLCATVIQLDPIKLVGFVPEAQVDRVEVGAPPARGWRPGARCRARSPSSAAPPIRRPAPSGSRSTVDNSDLGIRDGQSAEIRRLRPRPDGASGALLGADAER